MESNGFLGLGPVRAILLFSGLALIWDALFMHLIMFNYGAVSLGWLDPYFSHAYIGIILVVAALYLRAGRAMC